MKFENYKVVVTGADNGVGLAVAQLFLNEGASVIGVGKDFSSAATLGDKFIPCSCDISDLEAIEEACEFILDKFDDELDTFVSADGFMSEGTPKDFEDEDFEKVINTVLRAPMTFERNLFDALDDAPSRNPSVVNVASVWAFSNEPDGFLYNVANSALIRYTKTAAMDFGEVRCNSVTPGIIPTDYAAKAENIPAEKAAQMMAVYTALIPAHRLCEPADVAEAVAYLASEDAKYITGTDIIVDGGLTTRIK